jgi:hypothetical protein
MEYSDAITRLNGNHTYRVVVPIANDLPALSVVALDIRASDSEEAISLGMCRVQTEYDIDYNRATTADLD